MTRPRTLAAGLLLALVALLLTPGAAMAATTGDVARALLTDPVYVDPQATAQVDRARLEAAVRGAAVPVYVAVLPAAAAAEGGPDGLTTAIGRRLGASAVLFTVSGRTLSGGAGSASGLAPGEAARIAAGQRDGDLTARLVAGVEQASRAAADGSPGGPGDSRGPGGSAGPGGGWAVLAVLALLAVGAGALLRARGARRRRAAVQDLQGARADVESLYGRLGADVAGLDPGDDPVARQALADASERYTATGALLSQADTPGEYAAARRTAVEGLTAARLVRTRLGLDPGPEVPAPPATGLQLQAAGPVEVDGQVYEASPGYAPGRRHYWGGGYVGGRLVPGGWYGVPFWEGMLLGGVLSGGLGGFGGGYAGPDDRGDVAGADDVRDAGGWAPGPGDWGGGGSGGGDWGGGGSGGGDWGGGDSGGGGDSSW